MREVDSQIAQAWSQGQNPGEQLTQEWQGLNQAFEQAGFVERVNLAIQSGMSPKVATAVADRETLEWITQATDQHKAAYDEALQKHHQEAEDILNLNMALLRHGIPELQNCRTQQEISATLDAIKMNNPTRGQALAGWFQGVNQAVAHAVRVREEVAQAQKTKFASWATNQDNIFRANNREFLSPEHQKQVALEAFEYLESLGITREETIRLHDEDIMFRSHVGQQVLLDAMQYRRMQKAKANLPSKRAPAAPVHVMKPGVAESGIGREPERMPSSFEGNSGLRDAAAILTNRRSKARR